MAAAADEQFPILRLARTDERSYCDAAREALHNEFWWYFNGTAPFHGYSKPLRDASGRGWFRVKAGFAWPVDFFRPFDEPPSGLTLKPLLGWQYPVATPAQADSRVVMNVIHELAGYDLSRVASNKRRAVRKGVRSLAFEALNPADEAVATAACEVWNSHVTRTGWNSEMPISKFCASWAELADWPGTAVIAARDPARDGLICAWLIARVIDDCVYVDTIASHSERLEHRPNDSIIFLCLHSAAAAGIRRAHYSLKSSLTSLEAFKESLGFVPHAFPTRLVLRWPVGPLLARFRPATFKRLRGDADWAAAVATTEESPLAQRDGSDPSESTRQRNTSES